MVVVAIGATLAFVAPASANSSTTSYTILDGPAAGLQVTITPTGHWQNGTGMLKPQSGGCDYRFEGKVNGVVVSGCAVPTRWLPEVYWRLARAITEEEVAIESIDDKGDIFLGFAISQLKSAEAQLDLWANAVNAATTGQVRDQLLQKKAESKTLDKQARDKVVEAKEASGHHQEQLLADARGLVQQALETKREAFSIVLDNVTIPGEPPTDPFSLGSPINLAPGTAVALRDAQHIIGTSNPGSPSAQAFYYLSGTPTNLGGGTPSTAYTFALGNSVMGEQNGRPAFWDSSFAFFPIGSAPGSVRGGNASGGVGFRILSGDEVATWFKKNFDHGHPGFKPLTIGDFSGGASLFTVNGNNLAFGDHFLSGSTGPFRAFSANLNTGKTTELFKPAGGSTQPLASNDSGLAAGGAVLADSSIQGTFFWGTRHFLPYGGVGQNTLVVGLNELGVGVGTIGPSGSTHAALFENGQAFDLNNLIPSGSGWTLIRANAIDDQGNIVGTGTLNSQTEAFLILDEPSP